MVFTFKTVVVVFLVCAFCAHSQQQATLDITCNPSPTHRFDVCPSSYCCVRDEFLPAWTYCKELSREHNHCTTRESETNCPCVTGLTCKPNVISSTGTASMYGRCTNMTTTTTSTTTTTTTPTTTAAATTTATNPVNTSSSANDTTTTTPPPATEGSTAGATTTTDGAPSVASTVASGHTPCPHGHSCEGHGHHHTHDPNVHGHHTVAPQDTIG